MKKIELVNELEKRFIIQNNQLFLKPAEQQPNKQKKRIIPIGLPWGNTKIGKRNNKYSI